MKFHFSVVPKKYFNVTKNEENTHLDGWFVAQAVEVGIEPRQIHSRHEFGVQQWRVAQISTTKFFIVRWVVDDAVRSTFVIIIQGMCTGKKDDQNGGEQDLNSDHFLKIRYEVLIG